jgi:hypothetical protein
MSGGASRQELRRTCVFSFVGDECAAKGCLHCAASIGPHRRVPVKYEAMFKTLSGSLISGIKIKKIGNINILLILQSIAA